MFIGIAKPEETLQARLELIEEVTSIARDLGWTDGAIEHLKDSVWKELVRINNYTLSLLEQNIPAEQVKEKVSAEVAAFEQRISFVLGLEN